MYYIPINCENQGLNVLYLRIKLLCTGNMYCADGVCDALELKDPGICAQDCAVFSGKGLRVNMVYCMNR